MKIKIKEKMTINYIIKYIESLNTLHLHKE